ncbi:unnamed protein product [Aphanomyces euteiches]
MDTRLDARLNALQDQMNKRFEEQAAQFKKAIDEVAAEAYTLASTSNQDEAVQHGLQHQRQTKAIPLSVCVYQDRHIPMLHAKTHSPNQVDRPCGYAKTHRGNPCRNASHKCKITNHMSWRFHLYHSGKRTPTQQEQEQMDDSERRLGAQTLNQMIRIGAMEDEDEEEETKNQAEDQDESENEDDDDAPIRPRSGRWPRGGDEDSE